MTCRFTRGTICLAVSVLQIIYINLTRDSVFFKDMDSRFQGSVKLPWSSIKEGELDRLSTSTGHVLFLANPISHVRWVVCCCRGELVLYCDLDSQQKCTLPWPWLHKMRCLGNSTVPRTGRARSFLALSGSHTGLPCTQHGLSFPQGPLSFSSSLMCVTHRAGETETDRRG